MSAKYSIGQFSVGYGETLHAPATRMGGGDSNCSSYNTMKTMVIQSVLL